jgi:hypothetical protein
MDHGESERVLVHRWRSEEKPFLSEQTHSEMTVQAKCKKWIGANPLRIILSRSGLLRAP